MARLGDEGGGDERREAFAVGHDGVGRLGREVLQQTEALQDAAQFVEERVQTCREGRLLVGGNDLSHHPDGWLQSCYHAWLHFKLWITAWFVGTAPVPEAAGGAQKCLIGAANCLVDNASTTILDSEMAVVLVSVYTFLPFAIMPLYTAAEKFDFSLLEAARDLGAKNFYAFRKIFIPGIRQGVVSAILMVFIPAIGSYVIPQMLGGTDCVLIGNKIFMRAIQNRNIPHASALATLMAVSVLVPIACAMWWKRHQDARDRKRLEAQTAKLIVSGVG